MNLMSFLGIIPLWDNLGRNLKEQWYSQWCQTRSPFSYRPKRSSVDHSLAISYLMRLDPTAYLSTSPKLVGIWYEISVGVRRSSPTSRLYYWPKIRIFQVSPQEASLVLSSRVENMGGS